MPSCDLRANKSKFPPAFFLSSFLSVEEKIKNGEWKRHKVEPVAPSENVFAPLLCLHTNPAQQLSVHRVPWY